MKPLTPRELEVVALIAEGKNTREIANILGIAIRTVAIHKTHSYMKTKTRNAVQLAKWYLENNSKKDLTGITDSAIVGSARTL
jgi:DNA-binding CsgD family transcriptional regulator